MNPLIFKVSILALELWCIHIESTTVDPKLQRQKAIDLVAAVEALRLEMDLPVPLHPRRPLT